MRILVFRLGAFGDTVIITPVLRHLHNQGNELIVVANERGVQVLKNNPHIKLLIEQKTDSVKIDALADHILWLKRKHHCERVIDFSESIEVSLSQHPRGPNYKLTKPERLARFNRNFYEHSFEWAGLEWTKDILKPEIFLEDSELKEAGKYIKDGYFNIMIGMSGSGNNKTWPHTESLCEQIVNKIPESMIVTTGDEKCQIIEPVMEGRITNLSGKIPMRIAMALTSIANLVIAPDTGIIHASGCFDTPKICLLGHNTIECISKHFTHDYSVESDPEKAECSPCLYLIYNKNLQCQTDEEFGGASICMSQGISPDRVFNRVKEVYEVFKSKDR